MKKDLIFIRCDKDDPMKTHTGLGKKMKDDISIKPLHTPQVSKNLKVLSNILTTALSEKKTLEDGHGIHRVSPTLHIQLHKNEARDVIEEIQSLHTQPTGEIYEPTPGVFARRHQPVNELLVDFLDSIRDYEAEAGHSLAHDERESIEIVNIFLENKT